MEFKIKDTNIVKGISILLMYMHHFYLSSDRYSEFDISFFPFTEAKINVLAVFCKMCVALFVLLSGYGMYVSYNKRYQNDVKVVDLIAYSIRRYLSLILQFMFVFLLSQIVFSWSGRTIQVYGTGGKIRSIIYFVIDMFGLAYLFGTPTYLGTWWYISIISLIIALFPIIMKCFKLNCWITYLLSIILPIVFHKTGLYFFEYLSVFIIGMIIAKYNILVKIKSMIKSNNFVYILSFVLGVFVLYACVRFRKESIVSIGFRESIISIVIVAFSFCYLSEAKYISTILQKIGEHSMTMYLFHTFIRTTFFKSFSYGFYNAYLNLFIFLVVTYILAYIIDYFKQKIGFNKLVKTISNSASNQFIKMFS